MRIDSCQPGEQPRGLGGIIERRPGGGKKNTRQDCSPGGYLGAPSL